MGLFNRNKRSSVLADTEGVSYQEVVDYLTEMDQPDFTKLLKVVAVYRSADKDVKKILNIKEQPVQSITLEGNFLDDDDDTINFLEDDIPQPKVKKAKSKK